MLLNRLGLARPTWLDRWVQPLPLVNIVRAYSVHPRYARFTDWSINKDLDAHLETAIADGHSVAALYVSPNGEFLPLPHLWSLVYYDQQPKLSAVIKLITEATEN